MIHSVRFAVVLDTNVIYPVIIRDLLFWFAHYELFTIKWSAHIFDEWIRVMKVKGIDSNEIDKRVRIASQAFPDALVVGYESLIPILELPDKDDCHVLAAAIKSNSNLIVTNNLKDFPEEYLNRFGISAKSADEFLADVIDLNPTIALQAFKEMVIYKKNPRMDQYKVLQILRKNGLQNAANLLHALI